MRSVDPFSFFVGHESIIAGLGGSTPSSDGRYCFHTNYLDVKPGRAVFHVTIHRPRATFGELNIRVMALPSGRDASVAASLVIDLEGVEAHDLHRGLRFLAVDGVKYALFGFVSDSADLKAEALDVAIEEIGAAHSTAKAAVCGEATQPRLALSNLKSTSSTRRLLAERAPTPYFPFAQPMQNNGDTMNLLAKRWPLVGLDGSDTLDHWSSCMALQTLEAVGLVVPSSRGLLVDIADPGLIDTLKLGGCSIDLIQLDAEDVDLLALNYLEADYDFVMVLASRQWQAGSRLETLCERVTECVVKAGFILMIVEIPGEGTAAAFRNRMQQLSLHCIGLGHDVMQLAFPQGDGWYPRAGATSRFIWIAKK